MCPERVNVEAKVSSRRGVRCTLGVSANRIARQISKRCSASVLSLFTGRLSLRALYAYRCTFGCISALVSSGVCVRPSTSLVTVDYYYSLNRSVCKNNNRAAPQKWILLVRFPRDSAPSERFVGYVVVVVVFRRSAMSRG